MGFILLHLLTQYNSSSADWRTPQTVLLTSNPRSKCQSIHFIPKYFEAELYMLIIELMERNLKPLSSKKIRPMFNILRYENKNKKNCQNNICPFKFFVFGSEVEEAIFKENFTYCKKGFILSVLSLFVQRKNQRKGAQKSN